MVNAHYGIQVRKLSVVDHDPARGRVEFPASSGTNNCADMDKKGIGPLPAGAYAVYARPQPYHDHPAFVLDPVDDTPLNDGWDGRVDGIHRGAFRIHVTVPSLPRQGSNGCIVLPADDLAQLWAFCTATVPGPVETVVSPNVNAPPDRFTNPLLGTLVVER